jgi:hypothetical protein
MKFYPEIISANSDIFFHGFYLWILKADSIPPHLILSYNGQYYNLSVHGKFVNQPLESLLKSIRQKKMKTLVLALANFEDLSTKLIESYNKFEKVEAPEITCLSPIKELFNTYNYSNSISTIHDLIPLLQKNNVITSNYGINLPINQVDNSFELPFYTIQDVYNCIDELNAEKNVAGK